MTSKHTIWTALLAASFLGTVACTDDEGNSETMDDETTTGGSAPGGMNGATGGAVASGGDRPGGTDDGSGGADGGSGGTDGGSGGTNGGAGGDTSACSTLGIADSAGLTSLVAAVEAAGLAATIEDGENLTIFAPTNDAFADLLDAVGVTGLGDLTAEQLVPILTYHVAGSVIASDDAVAAAAGAGKFQTLGGTVAIVGETSDGLFLDPDEANAQIDLSAVDVEACKGTIVHVIDAVILPSIADIVTTQPGFSGLLSLVAAADAGTGTPKVGAALDGSADADDGDPVEAFTLFAPSNAAVEAVVEALGDSVPENQALTDVLLYHVYAGGPAVDAGAAIAGGSDQELPTLAGSNLTVDGEAGPPPVVSIEEGSAGTATVVVANIYASNGIIHVVDDVLLP